MDTVKINRIPNALIRKNIKIHVESCREKITLITLYGPNIDQPSFYDEVFNIIEEFGSDKYVICVWQGQSVRSRFRRLIQCIAFGIN